MLVLLSSVSQNSNAQINLSDRDSRVKSRTEKGRSRYAGMMRQREEREKGKWTVMKHEMSVQTERSRETRELTRAQTGLGRSQRESHVH